MRRIVTLAAISALGGLLLSVSPGAAETAAPVARPPTDVSSQSRTQKPRTRIRVQPLYPYRRFHSLYPLPYDVEYPGPNARRDCSVRYVQEYRPSGTVVVPRMNCWWVRG
jgi:hypothetical protein